MMNHDCVRDQDDCGLAAVFRGKYIANFIHRNLSLSFLNFMRDTAVIVTAQPSFFIFVTNLYCLASENLFRNLSKSSLL